MRLAVIGAGGIGSMFCRELSRMIRCKQFGDTDPKWIHVYDDDVVEYSNLRHQDYTEDDLSLNKAWIMQERYGFKGIPRRFETKDLTSHQTFVVCADNPHVRTLVYEHCQKFNKFFVDMRSEGDRIAVFTSNEDPKFLLSTLGPDKSSEEGRSCQLESDSEAGIVQLGNASVAPVGLQVLMHKEREESFPKSIIQSITGPKTIRA